MRLTMLWVLCGTALAATLGLIWAAEHMRSIHHIETTIDRYINERRIEIGKKSYEIEDLSLSPRVRLAVGYAFYNLIFQIRQHAKATGAGISAVRINERYAPKDLNIYFFGHQQVAQGLLSRYSIWTARAFPERRLVIVNTQFMNDL